MDSPDVIYQAAFFDGEFLGYADFVERAEDGWVVCDAKLARTAKPKALLQLGAYAHQIQRMHLPLSSTVSLLLGSGERADFSVSDVLPVFLERRERLCGLLASHRAGGEPVAWDDQRFVACGTLPRVPSVRRRDQRRHRCRRAADGAAPQAPRGAARHQIDRRSRRCQGQA